MSSRGRPRAIVSDHRVEDAEQLAHRGHQRDFGGLADRAEAAVVGADDGVEAGRDEGGHIERAADLRAPAPEVAGPRWQPLSTLRGATPTSLAIAPWERRPSSGSETSSRVAVCRPMPGADRSSCSRASQQGQRTSVAPISRSVALTRCSSQRTCSRRLGCIAGCAVSRRWRSAVSMSSSCWRRVTSALSAVWAASGKGRAWAAPARQTGPASSHRAHRFSRAGRAPSRSRGPGAD